MSDSEDVICDPFSGSGTFGYASLDLNRITLINEWEPYAFQMSTAPFRGALNKIEFMKSLDKFKATVEPLMRELYKTKCPDCGKELMFDGLFYDRRPKEFYCPTHHERMGKNGENVIFRRSQYKCVCGKNQKKFDDFDYSVMMSVNAIEVDFPQVELMENSRINFSYPEFIIYSNLFSHRQQIALVTIYNALEALPEEVQKYYLDTFLSIIHLGKYTDYRSKSQDNHCPENRLKETNLYHRFLEALISRDKYISKQSFDLSKLTISCKDYRSFLNGIPDNSVKIVLTDPPYGDSAQYFEHAQRVHPFMKYSLTSDKERLSKEVVISNAPSRKDKHGKTQFMNDIETLFLECSRIVCTHGYFVLYFRPEQGDWISDLNKLKHFGRKYGIEPLITIPIDNTDPSMRVLASAAWTFKKDTCFIFLKLNNCERRWYIDDTDIDELVYLSALSSSDNRGMPFIIEQFYREFRVKAAREGLMRLFTAGYEEKVLKTLEKFCKKENAQYILTGLSPYSHFNREMNAEIRLREFAPVVIEELTIDGNGFTFEDYIIHLASFMENGSRDIIQALHTANRLVPELLLRYAEEDLELGKFFARSINIIPIDTERVSLRTMDPTAFEHLIANYFVQRGFVKTQVIGRSCDRGVDILATNPEGELELIQCKRYRQGNNIGSTPIQRVDSYMRSRNARKAWVVTTSDFTIEGVDEARITGVILINGDKLIQSLEVYYPRKYTL